MVKRSVTPLQRDANYGSPYAEAGQASCDCSRNLLEEGNVKIKVKKKVSVTEERSSLQQLQRPSEKNLRTDHLCALWLAKMLVLVRKAEQPAQPSPGHLGRLSTGQSCPPCLVYLQVSAWKLFKLGFHGSYLPRALLIICNLKVR